MRPDSTTLRSLLPVLVVGLCACAGVPVRAGGAAVPDGEIDALRLRMAESLVQQRDYDLALPYVRDLLARNQANARLHFLLGVVLREKGVFGPAQQELERSLALDGTSSATHAALASLFGRRHRHADAERHHRRAIALAPLHAPHHNDLGVCLLLQRRYADARRTLQEAIRLDPGLRVAFNNLGFVLAMEGDDEGMRRAFQQAGGRAMALTNLGLVEQLRGKPVAARQLYEEALREQRGYAPALRNLRVLDPTLDARPGDPEEIPAGAAGNEEVAR